MTPAARSRRSRLMPVVHGLVLVGLLFLAYLFVIVGPVVGTFGYDAFAYWNVSMADPYAIPVGGLGAFTYTPVAARLFDPAGAMPWPDFLWLWTAFLVGTVLWLGGHRFAWVLAFPPVALELFHGNIHLLLAAMIVLGFRYPAVYAFGVFTKVTPGIGLVWFLVRREWRPLGIALGVIVFIAVPSLILDTSLWREWLGYALGAEAGNQVQQAQVPIPLLVRVPAALLIVAWGAHTDRRWTVPVAVTLSLPVLWPSGFAVLAACLAVTTWRGRPLVPEARWLPGRAASPSGLPDARG